MPRLLHLADVHLGARHHDLGEAAAAQRERQFAAFVRAIDLALAERVDIVLVAGDLFDSNQQPRRSVERVAGEFRRLVHAGIPVAIIPGTHDCYEPASIYRAYDLAALAGVPAGPRGIAVFTPGRGRATYPEAGIVVHGRVFDTKRAPESPLAGFRRPAEGPPWHVALVHGSMRLPGRVEQDDVLVTEEEIAASGLDYLALGHWHSFQQGRAGTTTWAYAGAPEPVAVDQDGAGQVLLVELTRNGTQGEVRVEPRTVGRTRFRRFDVDTSSLASQDALVRRITAQGDPDLVLDVRLTGVRPERLDLDLEEARAQAASGFFRLVVRDASVPAPPDAEPPPADTVAGAFIRDLQGAIAAAERSGDGQLATDLREALRLGRALLEDPAAVTL